MVRKNIQLLWSLENNQALMICFPHRPSWSFKNSKIQRDLRWYRKLYISRLSIFIIKEYVFSAKTLEQAAECFPCLSPNLVVPASSDWWSWITKSSVYFALSSLNVALLYSSAGLWAELKPLCSTMIFSQWGIKTRQKLSLIRWKIVAQRDDEAYSCMFEQNHFSKSSIVIKMLSGSRNEVPLTRQKMLETFRG